ncbi:transmembrane gamma-carboxyglutamic acid protein 4-like [Anguilla anguilla]|uniref:transmembrane gamma-carboxyglutamic acid protein 4-like n=1 Tax=Anguilla anguilla TaxID=7936 RepID=UPI0015AEF6E1|nr:transmembrane gamma-carboxyglutamic acid protein 4-like [Anguilla anguilla]
MLFIYLFLCALLCGFTVCEPTRGLTPREDPSGEVFVEEEAANKFLGRHLLFNRFDFEIFTPGNLERECIEEVCNYEEAREVFENIPQTDAFWKQYTEDHKSRPSRVDVTALLIGLLAAAISIVVIALLTWFVCQRKYKKNRTRRAPARRGSSAPLSRVPETTEIPMQTIDRPTEHVPEPGLPTYEQAMTNVGPHDAAPPPYPGSRRGSRPR